MSARSVSPGGSIVALSDRMSLASGSLPGGAHDTPLSPQQLGVMGNCFILFIFLKIELTMAGLRIR